MVAKNLDEVAKMHSTIMDVEFVLVSYWIMFVLYRRR